MITMSCLFQCADSVAPADHWVQCPMMTYRVYVCCCDMRQHRVAQLRLWHGALKWVALWALLSVLTLMHAAGLVHAMADVSVAKVRLCSIKLLTCSAEFSPACVEPRLRQHPYLSTPNIQSCISVQAASVCIMYVHEIFGGDRGGGRLLACSCLHVTSAQAPEAAGAFKEP